MQPRLSSRLCWSTESERLLDVRYLADRIAVMYVGRIVELGTTDQIFEGPNHPYTEALLSAVPNVDGEAAERIPLTGEIPSPANPPPGCVFHTRCQYVIEGTCDVEAPPDIEVELDPGESAVAEAGSMMYKDESIVMETVFGDGSPPAFPDCNGNPDT